MRRGILWHSCSRSWLIISIRWKSCSIVCLFCLRLWSMTIMPPQQASTRPTASVRNRATGNKIVTITSRLRKVEKERCLHWRALLSPFTLPLFITHWCLLQPQLFAVPHSLELKPSTSMVPGRLVTVEVQDGLHARLTLDTLRRTQC